MFFVLSKVIWALLSPASLVSILLLAGVIMAVRWCRAGAGLVILSALTLFVFGILPTGQNLLHGLERVTARPDPMPDKIAGILVLGGGIETRASEISGQPEVNNGADRILAGVTLARQYPDAKLVFSGGSGLLLDQDLQESRALAQLLSNIGFPAERVIYEDSSRNTYENIRNSQKLLAPAAAEKWFLVTSAYHMKRSLAVSRHLGWDLLPYPVDYQSAGHYVFWPERYDVLESLYLSELALREWVGLLAYRITGKL